MMIDYKNQLNGDQYEVAVHGDGPCLVLAGAGSGKTRTLVFRVAYLIENGIAPENILLVTFTNKASREMLERVEKLLGFKPEYLWGGTFHHIGNLILRKYANKIGYERNFNILDEDDSVSLVKSAMESLGLNVKGQNFPKARIVKSIIGFSRNTNQPVRDVAEEIYGYPDFIAEKMDEISGAYEEKKKKSNAMDFDDLLVNWLKLLLDFPEIKEKYSNQFKYILVDEYQDTNFIQAEIIRNLSSVHNNVLVVGDDSQSIYSFRAADVKNILNFPKLFNNTKIFKIEKNYRSTPQILDLANSSIRNNVNQFEKSLMADRDDGYLPALIPARDEHEQASLVTRKIMGFYRAGKNYEDMAVLYRSSYHSAEIQLQLSKMNIPYVVRGGMRYFEQSHIKDVISYLKVLSNFSDEIAWKRIMLMFEGIGEKKAEKIWQEIQLASDLPQLIERKIKLTGKASDSWEKIMRIFSRLNKIDKNQRGFIAESIDAVLESGYEAYLKNVYENYRDRMDDLQQLINFVAIYNDLDKLLTDVMLSENFAGENENNRRALVLSTIHQAKGLEWPIVFVVGLRDGQFPHHKSMEKAHELEEERRLFYVAVTRAKDELNLLYPIRSFSYKYGEQYSKPSTFIREIDAGKYMVEKGRNFREEDDENFVIEYD
ncbi:UvrD-helicase domain-containing protein [Patescibacteria group bacterium]|nr:UvrD-helicase domain-containing protein [Patescibacteria group bacterium]